MKNEKQITVEKMAMQRLIGVEKIALQRLIGVLTAVSCCEGAQITITAKMADWAETTAEVLKMVVTDE